MKTSQEFREEMDFIELQLESFWGEGRRLNQLWRELREEMRSNDERIKQYNETLAELEQHHTSAILREQETKGILN